MHIVVLLPWIALSALLVPADNVSTEPTCGANHTKLLLLADVYHGTNLTISRLKNIVSYFITKEKDGIIKTLDVCLVDPLQQKTLFNLTKVNSSGEILSALDQLVQSDVSYAYYDKYVNDKKELFLAFQYPLKLFSSETADTTDHKQHVVILSRCDGRCKEIRMNAGILQFLKSKAFPWFDVHGMSHEIDQDSDAEGEVYWYDEIGINVVYIDSKVDFNYYNPVTLDHCKDCPKGWTQYTLSGHRISCYWIDTLETPISWLNASRRCKSFKSSLPAIETEHELKFLIERLENNSIIRTAYLNVNQKTMTAVVNVGLLKRFGFQQHHYMWTNLRPFNLEASFESSDDSRDRCVVFYFPLNALNLKDEVKWKIVNCYKLISRILVCEMEGKLIHNFIQMKDKIKNAAESIQNINLNVRSSELVTHLGEKSKLSWGMFHCQDGRDNVVTYRVVCDGSRDCNNGRDEQYCHTMSSKEKHGEYVCVNPNGVGDYRTTTSIPSEAHCNIIQDCPDNSDEQGCDGCLGRQCQDHTCIPGHWLSRDRDNCHLSEAYNSIVHLNVSYPCKDQCFGLVQLNVEISFCNKNVSFQHYLEGQGFNKNLSSGLEWSPKCLYLRGSDRSPTGCHNKYHLRDCGTFQCPEGFLKCPDSYCLPVYNFGDGVLDCPYGEDEVTRFETFHSIGYTFRCSTSFEKSVNVIHLVHICDGVSQCPYGEDEMYCGVKCPKGFKCNGQAVEIENHTLVQEIKSLNIFDFKTKFLNLTGIDLSKVEDIFIFANLLEIHASNCNLSDLEENFGIGYENQYIYTTDLSYNNLKVLTNVGPLSRLNNLQFLNLSHNINLNSIGYFSVSSRKLHTLDFSFTAITCLNMDILRYDNTLRHLNLYNSKIKHACVLPQLKTLEFLNLKETWLVAEEITHISKRIPVSLALYVDNYKYCCPQFLNRRTPKHACHAPSEAFSSCEDLLSDSLKRSLLWMMAVVALAGNIVVITYRLFYDRGVFKKGYGIFVTNLSVSDFVMGVYLLIIASTDVHYRGDYVLHESVWRHSTLCQSAGFLSTLSSETSTFFVFLITLDRCLVIKFPFGDHMFTKLGLVLSVLCAWIFGFILASIPLIYPDWIIYSSNGMCLGLPLAIVLHPGWHYSFGVFICFNFTLFLCIACGQSLIFRWIMPRHSFQMPNTQSVARRMQDISVAKQLFLVVLTNFLCWFPICVLGFLSMTGNEVSPDTYAWLVVFVMPLNAAINPMIYTIPVMYSKWQDFKKGKVP